MAKTADNVLRAVGLAHDNQPLTMKAIRSGFYSHGYGVKKTENWIDLYLKAKVIIPTDKTTELGAELYDTIYWETNRNALS